MSDTTAKQLVRNVFELSFGKGDLDAVDAALTPAAVDDHPFAEDEPDMATQLKGVIGMFRAAAPDLHVTVTHLLEDGDHLAARVEMSGHHTGTPLVGVPAADKPFTITQFHVVDVGPDGRCVRHWANVGLEELRTQLA